LNWDPFTNVIIDLLNTSLFTDFYGTLDATGIAAAQMNMLPFPGAAGLSLYFAFALIGPCDFASNPVVIEIVP